MLFLTWDEAVKKMNFEILNIYCEHKIILQKKKKGRWQIEQTKPVVVFKGAL